LGKLEIVKYIINKQLGCGYSFMKNEIFKVNSRKGTKDWETKKVVMTFQGLFRMRKVGETRGGRRRIKGR